MARPQIHSMDIILDAARDVALDLGVRAATIGEIARVSGAPVGSLYHRFGSRDDLLAHLWIRAVRRAQASFLAAIDHADPAEGAVAGALQVFDFCEQERGDARLLLAFRREDLLRGTPSPEVVRELQDLNGPLERGLRRLARSIFGKSGRLERERVLLAVFDIPYGAARRHLLAGGRFPATLRSDVERAVRAVLNR